MTSSTQTHWQRYCSYALTAHMVRGLRRKGTGHTLCPCRPQALTQQAAEVRGLSPGTRPCQGPHPRGYPHRVRILGPLPRLYRGGRPKTATLVYISSRARGMETSGFGTPFWGSQIHAFWPISGYFGGRAQNGLIGPSPGFRPSRDPSEGPKWPVEGDLASGSWSERV